MTDGKNFWSPLDVRVNQHMDAGNDLRAETGLGDAIALLGVGAVRKLRKKHPGATEGPNHNTAYILRSLKHPHEVETLRRIYGPSFVLIAAGSRRSARIENLAARIAASHNKFQAKEFRSLAEALNRRDEIEVGDDFGQNVRDTFPLADVFIDTGDPAGAEHSIARFIDLLFGYQFHTPTRDEFAMFHCQASALRSSALGRQVGAVITTTNKGDIITVGTNEVPKSGGGLYWCDDVPDHRDFKLGFDTNDQIKVNIVAEILSLLKDAGWFSEEKSKESLEDLVSAALVGKLRVLPKSAQVSSITEFGRSVHAEMAALCDAARRGTSVDGGTLYTTTFPCHNCAKHIVAAGIKHVVYIEPYPKSLALDLHLDSIEVDGAGFGAGVNVTPFVGIAPRLYMELFSAPARKGVDGRVAEWNIRHSSPRFGSDFLGYSIRENTALTEFYRAVEKSGIKPVG